MRWDWIGPIAAVAGTFGAVLVASRLSRWYAGRRDQVDALIAKGGFRYRPGMERMDWQKTDRAGEVRWQAALKAQRKTRKRPRGPVRLEPDRLVAFRSRKRG